jgi:hypothetical protein
LAQWPDQPGLAQRPESVGSNPTRPPTLSLTCTRTRSPPSPLFPLATTTPLRRRRSPPAAPGQPRHRRDGAMDRLVELYPSVQIDLISVVSRGRLDPETLVVTGGSTVACCCSGRRRSPPPTLLPGVASPRTSRPSVATSAPPPFPHAFLMATLAHGWLSRRRVSDAAAARLL